MKMIFSALFVLSLLTSLKVVAKEYPISSGRSIEQRADSLFEMVTKELIFTPKQHVKFKAIQMTTEQLRQLLSQIPNGEQTFEEQTAYIKEYIAILKSLPTAKELKNKECEEHSVDQKAEPLLQSLCGQVTTKNTSLNKSDSSPESKSN